MIPPVITKLPQSQVQIKFTVTPDEAKPYLEQAAIDLQESKPIPGFRPGKAPYEEVKKMVGDMRIWETALERIVRAKYVHTVLEEHIDSIGSPAISVEQLVPGQDLKFTVTVSVMPTVSSLIAYDKPLVSREQKEIRDADVEKTLEDLRRMRRKEVVVDRPAGKEDLVMIDLEVKKDGVVVEGGTSQNYRIYLNEPHYIPGFAEALEGLKKGDVKTFTLPFPKEHYQKHLAGQDVDFSVTAKDVYELQLPALDDAFAKQTGLESLDKLKDLLRDNLTREAEQKADEASEIELLEKLVSGSKFSEIPELLVNEELRRMYTELEHAAEDQGMDMSVYLQQLKKTADQIKLDMVPQAMKRIQTAVLIKEIGKKENITIDDTEVDAEIDRILKEVKDQATRERVSSPEYRDYVASQMKNRKTLEALKKKGIKN